MWNAIWAIVYKEYIQAIRGKDALRRMLTFQVLMFLMLAWLDTTVRNMPAVIVDQDHTAESRLLVERLRATNTFKIKYSTSSRDQAREHIRAGRAKVAVVIPPEYARLRASGAPTKLSVLVDGSDSPTSAQAVAAVDGAIARLNLEAEEQSIDATPKVVAHSVLLFNPTGSMSSFMLPGLLAISLGIGYSGIGMRRLIAERMGGNLERLLMTPLNYTGLIIGKLLPYLAIGMVNTALYICVMRWGFGVPIRGNLGVLMLGTFLYLFTVLALGTLAASGAKHYGEASAIWTLTNLPSIALSGYIFPLSSLPKPLLVISYAIPQTYFIEVTRGVCLRGASLSELAPSFVYLAVAPVVFSVVAAIRFKRAVID